MKAIIASVFALGLLGASVSSVEALTIHVGTGHHDGWQHHRGWHHNYGWHQHRRCIRWGWRHHTRYCRGWRW